MKNTFSANSFKETTFWFLGLLFCDQITKFLFYDLEISGFGIVPVMNHGISFSIAVQYEIILIVTLLMLLLFIRMRYKDEIDIVSFSFFASGAVGNFIDRLVYGGVRDFISILSFPIFNFADTFLFVGVVLVLWGSYRKGK